MNRRATWRAGRGRAGLDHACGDFESAWLYRLERYRATSNPSPKARRPTHHSYQELDDEVTKAMGALEGNLT
jgi:hypothetical protein